MPKSTLPKSTIVGVSRSPFTHLPYSNTLNRRGVANGATTHTAVLTTVLGIAFDVFDFGLPIDQAIAAPRISQRNGGMTQVDSGFETSELGLALTQLGHGF